MSTIDRRRLLQAAAALAATAAGVRGAGPAARDLGETQPLDGRPPPAYDYTRASKLPREMTGYWTRSFEVAGTTRTAKVYISPETPIRSYYTVIAVPDGVETAHFLRSSGWAAVADRREEGLVVLEPGPGGWRGAEDEAAYVDAVMSFYESNSYFSIFGLHYLVGYGSGAPALEAWAVAHPLRVIAQVYVDSPGLDAQYLDSYAAREFGGQTAPGYTTVDFPAGFDLIRYDETVLPTWYIRPHGQAADASLSYWKRANDTAARAREDHVLGAVYAQRRDSRRWMTSYAGPISRVAVQRRPVDAADPAGTRRIVGFLTRYSRYENFFAYGNQLVERADYARLGIDVRTMMVEGFPREYLVHVPASARRLWKDRAPVVFVWPGNSQTAKVFLDASQWWTVAEREGCVLVIIGEQYSTTSVTVSHRDSLVFYRQLRDLVSRQYPVDPTRFYSTGQSAGSAVTQNLAIAFPQYFAAVASTSFTTAPDATGAVIIDGVSYAASGLTIPDYQIYGYGDLPFLAGDLWDDTQNSLDSWARYHLDTSDLTLSDVDSRRGGRSGWHDRFRTWSWRSTGTGIPVLKLTKNLYRSHNTMAEESQLLWDFLKHYARDIDADGTVVRYFSRSGFRHPGDRQRL